MAGFMQVRFWTLCPERNWGRAPFLETPSVVGYNKIVRLLRQYHFIWTFLVVLLFCSVMVLRQFNINRHRHNELREAFILLHARGYTNQADRLYYRLLVELDRAPDRVLLDDFQRTMMLVEPEVPQPKNLVWKYHWTVSNELEKRSTKAFGRALKLAEDTQ